MAKNKKAEPVAAEAAQGVREQSKVSQDAQEVETAPEAPDAPQEGAATQEIIGPDDLDGILGCQDADGLLGCQDADEAELAEGLFQSYAVTAKGGLRIRVEPTLDAPVVAVLPCGAGVFGDGEPGPDGWLHVFTGRLSGWMFAKHLEPFPVQDLSYGAD